MISVHPTHVDAVLLELLRNRSSLLHGGEAPCGGLHEGGNFKAWFWEIENRFIAGVLGKEKGRDEEAFKAEKAVIYPKIKEQENRLSGRNSEESHVTGSWGA